MMKLVKVLLIALPLGACAGFTPSDLTTEIATIQADAKQLCGVVPATLDVAALISGNAVVGGASAIASAVCNAVTSAPVTTSVRRGSVHSVVVNGVVVHYQ